MGQESQVPAAAARGVQGIGTSMNTRTVTGVTWAHGSVSGWVSASPGYAPDGSRRHHTVQTGP